MFWKIWMLVAPSVWRNCVRVKAACPFIKSLWIETWWNVSANITCCCVSSPCTIVGGSPWLLASRHPQQWRRRGIIVLLVIFQLWVIISWYKMTPTDTESWAHETVSQSLVFESDVIRLAVSWWEMVQYPADQYNEDDIHTHALWNLSVEGTWLWAYFVMWCCKGYINNSKMTLI